MTGVQAATCLEPFPALQTDAEYVPFHDADELYVKAPLASVLAVVSPLPAGLLRNSRYWLFAANPRPLTVSAWPTPALATVHDIPDEALWCEATRMPLIEVNPMMAATAIKTVMTTKRRPSRESNVYIQGPRPPISRDVFV